MKRAKTETLSLRLDPKSKFTLDFIARINGQSITTVVERAVKDAAASVFTSNGFSGSERNWSHYWDSSEGIRTLNLLCDPNYPTNFEEDELNTFIKAHWQFFFTSQKLDVPRRAYVDILWPNVTSYQTIWQDQKLSNFWAAGEAMTKALLTAKVEPPDWPGKKTTGPRESFSADLDDEIPF